MEYNPPPSYCFCKSCSAEGGSCSSDSDCCSGLSCVDGVCYSCSDDSCENCRACSQSECDSGAAAGCYWDESECIKDRTVGSNCVPQSTCSVPCPSSNPWCVGSSAGCDDGVTCCYSYMYGEWGNWCSGVVELIECDEDGKNCVVV